MLARKTPIRRTPFKRGKPKPQRLLLPDVPKATGKLKVAKGPWRSRKHMNRVAAESCLIRSPLCWGKTDPHHVKIIVPSGTCKPPDWTCVPLCRNHHTLSPASVHGMGDERKFWARYGIDPRDFIRSFSPEGARALEEATHPAHHEEPA